MRFSFKKLVLWVPAAVLLLWLVFFAWVWLADMRMEKRTAGDIEPADSALVLSTKVYERGRLNPCLVARVRAGAELWKAGKVKRLVMSGGINRDFRHGAQTMQVLAEQMGVPADAIVQEGRAADTYQNIVYSTPLLENDRSVVLVSSGFHLRRAVWMAKRQWPDKRLQIYAHAYCYPDARGYLYDLVRETAAIVKNGWLERY